MKGGGDTVPVGMGSAFTHGLERLRAGLQETCQHRFLTVCHLECFGHKRQLTTPKPRDLSMLGCGNERREQGFLFLTWR